MKQRINSLCEEDYIFPAKFGILKLASLLCLLATPVLRGDTINIPIASSGAMITTTNNVTTYCSLQGSPVSCSYGGATSSAAISNGGSAQAFAGMNSSLAASSSTLYGIAVTGSSSTPVPVIISGTTTESDNGQSDFGIAFIGVIDDNLAHTGVVSQYFSSSYGCSLLPTTTPPLSCTSPGAYTFNELLTPGDVYFVELTAGAAGGGNASAAIDPSIVINPSFAQANQFTLIASPGVFSSAPPTTSTPEPASFGMFGFAAAGGLLYGKLRKRIGAAVDQRLFLS